MLKAEIQELLNEIDGFGLQRKSRRGEKKPKINKKPLRGLIKISKYGNNNKTTTGKNNNETAALGYYCRSI